MQSETVVRVLVVDEHEIVRRGVGQVLRGAVEIRVVGEAASFVEALRRGQAVRPDVAVVGMRLPDGTGAEVCERLRARVQGLRCLVLSRDCAPDTVAAALRAGVSGYLLENVDSSTLLSAVRVVAAGGTLYASEVAPAGTPSRNSDNSGPLEALTPRERRILQLIGEGLTNRQIGVSLGRAEKTVKNYIGPLLAKLGLERRTQAAILATRLRGRLGSGRRLPDGVGPPAVPPRPGAGMTWARGELRPGAIAGFGSTARPPAVSGSDR
jgi:two-component system, NarL family, response regulator DevR